MYFFIVISLYNKRSPKQNQSNEGMVKSAKSGSDNRVVCERSLAGQRKCYTPFFYNGTGLGDEFMLTPLEKWKNYWCHPEDFVCCSTQQKLQRGICFSWPILDIKRAVHMAKK